MPRRRRNASQRYHDRVAGKYETIYSDAYWKLHDAITWDYIKPHLPKDLRSPTADLGCGSGKWSRKLLKSGYHVTFIDSSAKMIDEARKQVLEKKVSGRFLETKKRGSDNNLSGVLHVKKSSDASGKDAHATFSVEQSGTNEKAVFIQADLIDLSELPTDHFALALAMGEPIGCTRDPAKALRQILRIIAPGGILIATFDNRIACIDHYLEKPDPDELSTFLRTGKTKWLTRDKAEQFDIHTFEPTQLEKLFNTNGFDILETIGKTVLPLRNLRNQLEDPTARRKWAVIEKKLARNKNNLARCPHLQITARKR